MLYLYLVQEKYILRKIIDTSRDLSTNAYESKEDVSSILDKAEKTISIQVHKINVKNKYTNKAYDSIVLAIKTPTTANLITEIDDQEF